MGARPSGQRDAVADHRLRASATAATAGHVVVADVELVTSAGLEVGVLDSSAASLDGVVTVENVNTLAPSASARVQCSENVLVAVANGPTG